MSQAMARSLPTMLPAFVVTLGGLSALAPLGIDMYVPGLPQIASEMDTTAAHAQLSVTAFLLGLVAGQVLFGPLADRFGRRRPLLAGMALSAVFTLVCAVAPTITVFLGGRFFAGFFGATGAVLSRAVVSDHFSGPRMARYFSVLALITGVAPVIAPAAGGLLLNVGSWRLVFVVLAVIGIGLAIAVACFVPESLPAERRSTGGVTTMFADMGRLIRDRRFTGQVLVLAFAAAGMFAYVSGSSFLFEHYYHTSATQFSLIFASCACAMLVCSSLFGLLAGRLNPATAVRIGVALGVVGTLTHVLFAFAAPSLAASWVCFAITLAGLGLIFPATTTAVQTLGRDRPGAASALLGAGQFALGAAISPLAGLFDGGPVPLAVVMAVAFACAAVAVVASGRTKGQ